MASQSLRTGCGRLSACSGGMRAAVKCQAATQDFSSLAPTANGLRAPTRGQTNGVRRYFADPGKAAQWFEATAPEESSRAGAEAGSELDDGSRLPSYEMTGHLQLLRRSLGSRVAPTLPEPYHSEMGDRGGGGEIGQSYKVGDTPMLDLSFMSLQTGVKILAKCEFANPTGSIKDRMVQYVLQEAAKSGELPPEGTIVAATSGNTGASVAMLSAMNGYKYIVITNEKCSVEKRNIMGAFGGEVRVTPSGVPADDPLHYQNAAITLCEENPGFYDLDQYGNQLNPEAYYHTLGPEIWRDTAGQVTHFLAGGSTGGTISGTSKFLKEMNPDVKVHMPDPKGSVFYEFHVGGVPEEELCPGSYQVEGVGKDSIPPTMHFDVVDSMVQVDDLESFQTCQKVAQNTGVLVGGSSGLNVFAASKLSATVPEGSVIVTVLPDSGFKYLSKIYNSEWMDKQVKKHEQAALAKGNIAEAR
eukprot:CAMPEP_0119133190 /NCGR_PEP_ID=MMETSP1310-20130426/13216_1 /TAXON_ID=464262 /ORGANISM="Genus nov. species nov., Strain RCC2339" /LENGTH=470 /DNA_ID=CAMNT_0007123875 /DNA_START=45 /DNA_END=1457 /DNA_ORIENTATION=-